MFPLTLQNVRYIDHLKHLDGTQQMRSRHKKDEKMNMAKQDYADYQGGELFISGKLAKLLVSDLDKYLDHHNIDKTRKKNRRKSPLFPNI